MADEQPKPPRGRAKRWSAAQLESLSKISDEDIAAAQERWRVLAPGRFRTLLDASLHG